MGHGVSCARTGDEHNYFRAAQVGDLDALDALLAADPSLARRATLYDRLSALHITAANGHLEVPPHCSAPHPSTASVPANHLAHVSPSPSCR
jgi:hypothetical protein